MTVQIALFRNLSELQMVAGLSFSGTITEIRHPSAHLFIIISDNTLVNVKVLELVATNWCSLNYALE